MEENKIYGIRKFSEAFLVVYAEKMRKDGEDKLYISPNIKGIMRELSEFDEFNRFFDYFGVLDEEGHFISSEFLHLISTSELKYAWADPFKVDFETGLAYSKFEFDKSKKVYDSYSKTELAKIVPIVDEFVEIQDIRLNENAPSERKYLVLDME